MKMPGINSKNVFVLMNKVDDLDHLVSLSTEELTEILDNEVNAQVLYKFLHRRCKSDNESAHSANGRSMYGKSGTGGQPKSRFQTGAKRMAANKKSDSGATGKFAGKKKR